MELNYEKDILIDETSLDVEWLNQAALAMRYGKYWADCQLKVQQAEERIKLIRAELVKEANEDPDSTLGEGVKPTGPNIEAYYRNHKRHKQAKQEWVEACYELNIADIAKKEISTTRKAALENLVRLHGQSYFSGPNMPRDINFEAEKVRKAKDTDGRIAERMKRNK